MDNRLQPVVPDYTGGNNPPQPDQPPPYTPRPIDTQPQPTTIINTIVFEAPLQKNPQLYYCHKCKQKILTRVKYISSERTHMLAGFIGGLTCFCLLCCSAALPYYCNTFKNSEHYCPKCDELLGTYTRM